MVSNARVQHRRWILLLLGVVVLAGLGLRIWYAGWNLTDQRYWDEKYSLDNVRPIMLERMVTPVQGYYPSPVFTLPAALLFEVSAAVGRSTDNPRLAPMKGWHFTPVAILLSRLLMTLYGTATLVLVFGVGKQMVSARVGLLAATSLAFSPWMIHSSGYFKPDALLVMTVTLAFYASLRAVESATARWYAAAGVAIALAMSAKLTGGLAAVPLIVATLHYGFRDRNRMMLLAFAGTVSAGVFVLVNPYWRFYPHFLSGLKRDYAMRAEWAADSKLGMPGRVVGMLVDDYGHGPLLGTVALLGLLLFAWSWVRRSVAPRERLSRSMLLVFVLSYTAAYSFQTPYFKGNNFLPLLPFTALAAAWVLDTGLRIASERFAGGFRWWKALVATGVVGLLVVPPGVLYVYRSLTPTTRDAALQHLARKLDSQAGRLAYVEGWQQPKTAWEGRRPFAAGEVGLEVKEAMQESSIEQLRATDGLVFRATGTRAPRWAKVGPHKKQLFEPRLFQLRGPPVWAIFHRWSHDGPSLAVEAEAEDGPPGWYLTALPAGLATGDTVSISVWLPHEIQLSGFEPPDLELGGQLVPLTRRNRASSGDALVSGRFVLEDLAAMLRFKLNPIAHARAAAHHAFNHKRIAEALVVESKASITVHVHRWRSGS